MCSDCLSTTIAWIKWELIFQIKEWLTEFSSHYHQVTRTSWWTIICKGWQKRFPSSSRCWNQRRQKSRKSIKCWWLTRPLVSSKRARERKGTSRRMASKFPLPWISPKLDPSMKLSASDAKEMVTGSGTTPSIWQIRRMAKWTKLYLSTDYWCVFY